MTDLAECWFVLDQPKNNSSRHLGRPRDYFHINPNTRSMAGASNGGLSPDFVNCRSVNCLLDLAFFYLSRSRPLILWVYALLLIRHLICGMLEFKINIWKPWLESHSWPRKALEITISDYEDIYVLHSRYGLVRLPECTYSSTMLLPRSNLRLCGEGLEILQLGNPHPLHWRERLPYPSRGRKNGSPTRSSMLHKNVYVGKLLQDGPRNSGFVVYRCTCLKGETLNGMKYYPLMVY